MDVSKINGMDLAVLAVLARRPIPEDLDPEERSSGPGMVSPADGHHFYNCNPETACASFDLHKKYEIGGTTCSKLGTSRHKEGCA